VRLAAALAERSRQALASGALRPVETDTEVVEEEGVRFVLRRLSSLARKAEARWRAERAAATVQQPPDPFDPPEPALTVGPVGERHVAVLNKYNVIDGHLLIVTRRYAPQEELLDESDLAALGECVAELGALGFYNGGEAAGASERHKHVQLVPLPLGVDEAVPMERFYGRRAGSPRIEAGKRPFRHAVAALEPDELLRPDRLHALYRELLSAIGVSGVPAGGALRQSAPYNLLVTLRWMVAVPRVREHYGTVSINALGFAGSFFVRDEAESELVRRAGPLRVLAAVSGD